jgi:hypothetical protein
VAEVFADEFMLNYAGTQKYLALIKTKVYDTSGNNNGIMDPGETVNLTAFLKNIGGAAFTGLVTTLSETSPYVTVTHDHGSFGALAVDSTKENSSDPYILQVASNAPIGTPVNFRIIATETGFADTFDFTLPIGKYHYYVWNPDPTPTSGVVIDSLLRALGYSGTINTLLPALRGTLDMYQAVFVCTGIYPNNKVIGSASSDAATLVDYLNAGGRMYMEGGDVWYYDPLVGGYNFCSLFGLSATSDGTSDLGPVAGQAGTFTRNMIFDYAGENSFMDHISPAAAGAFLIFTDTDNAYDCGVAQNTGLYRTVGTSFELGGLVDGAGNYNLRVTLVDSIMKFFGAVLIGVDEQAAAASGKLLLSVAPNPFHGQIVIKCAVSSKLQEKPGIRIFDATGRLVKTFSLPAACSLLPAAVAWTGTDDQGRRVSPGIYFIRLDTRSTGTQVEKVILLP